MLRSGPAMMSTTATTSVGTSHHPKHLLGDSMAPQLPQHLGRRPIAVVGPAQWRERFVRLLKPLPNPTRTASRPSQLAAAQGPFAGAVISMSKAYTIFSGIARLRSRIGAAPLVAVVPKDIQPNAVHQMIERGATGILAWPDEAFFLSSLLIAAPPDADAARNTESVLEANIRCRIDVQFGDAPVDIFVSGSACRLEGFVPSLLRKMELVSIVENMPGVDRIQTDALVVDTIRVEPDELTTEVRLALRLTDGIDSSTICAVASPFGRVTIAGTMSNEHERHRAYRAVAAVPGVTDIQDLSTQSTAQKAQDRSAHRRAELALNPILAPTDHVRLSIFGKIGFISGHVESSRKKAEVEQALRRAACVDRIVNEVEVHS